VLLATRRDPQSAVAKAASTAVQTAARNGRLIQALPMCARRDEWQQQSAGLATRRP
jgi:hypothetical protein